MPYWQSTPNFRTFRCQCNVKASNQINAPRAILSGRGGSLGFSVESWYFAAVCVFIYLLIYIFIYRIPLTSPAELTEQISGRAMPSVRASPQKRKLSRIFSRSLLPHILQVIKNSKLWTQIVTHWSSDRRNFELRQSIGNLEQTDHGSMAVKSPYQTWCRSVRQLWDLLA